jgi:hypothetical protein
MNSGLRNYLIVTGGYWAFTLTDGAIRMLVVLYFHLLGYSPFEVAMLFLFYEFFGIVTNLVGGWLGARIGLNLTMQIGMGLQVFALMMLTVPDAWLTVAYVMLAQALSGIAKDLNKMSAKASIKTLVRESGGGVAAVPLDVGAHRLQECAQGHRLLPRWPAVAAGGFPRCPDRAGRHAAAGAARHPGAAAGRAGPDEGESPSSPRCSPQPGAQLAVGGALLPVRRARCLVRGGPAGVPLFGAGLVLQPGGWFPGPVDHRLRHRAGERATAAAPQPRRRGPTAARRGSGPSCSRSCRRPSPSA